jgi:phosphopantothenoylcysteine decarboxylase/phosphopantothenate--cysteine ligase
MHFLITAGGTREYIDPVRFISNASSGKMGYALAAAALKTGHKVTLITAPAALQTPPGAKIIAVQTAKEMFDAVRRHFKKCDCLIMSAAVADYTPVKKSKIKIKKANKNLVIKLRPTVDILKWARKSKKKNQVIIGFALEDKNLRANAEKKLKEKNLDMIIANTPASIGSDKSSVEVKISNRKWVKFPQMTKTEIAGRIIPLIESISR